MISIILLWYHRVSKNTQNHMILVCDIILNIIFYVAWYHASISYMPLYGIIYTCYDIAHDIAYDIMTSALLRSTATLGSSSLSSCLTASLPTCLCYPGPAFADSLAPDPLSLCGGPSWCCPCSSATSRCSSNEPAIALVLLHVSGGASKTLSLKLCGIVVQLLPLMKHWMKGALPSTFATGQMAR